MNANRFVEHREAAFFSLANPFRSGITRNHQGRDGAPYHLDQFVDNIDAVFSVDSR